MIWRLDQIFYPLEKVYYQKIIYDNTIYHLIFLTDSVQPGCPTNSLPPSPRGICGKQTKCGHFQFDHFPKSKLVPKADLKGEVHICSNLISENKLRKDSLFSFSKSNGNFFKSQTTIIQNSDSIKVYRAAPLEATLPKETSP